MDPDLDGGGLQVAGTVAVGVAVQVRTRFDGSWASGFDVAEIVADRGGEARYRLRRALDGVVLPVLFAREDVVVTAPDRARG